jgi:hypothetical protein
MDFVVIILLGLRRRGRHADGELSDGNGEPLAHFGKIIYCRTDANSELVVVGAATDGDGEPIAFPPLSDGSKIIKQRCFKRS